VIRFVASVSSKEQPSDWLKLFDSQSEASFLMVFEANTHNKTEHTM